MSVGRICTREVDVATADEAVWRAAERMHERSVGTLVVVDESQDPIGIITDRDLVVRVLADRKDPEETLVGEVMSRRPATALENTPIEIALERTAAGGFRRMPVVDHSGKLVGLVTLDDILLLVGDELSHAGKVTNSGTLIFNTSASAPDTIGGTFTNNPSASLIVQGNGSLEIDAAPTLGNESSISVGSPSRLKFNVTSGAASIGTGVTATVSSGATLELAGSVSALSSGPHRANITNNSTAPGLIVSGTHQQVGNVDGSGSTQVNAGSDLTANHIIQSAVAIGGTAGSPGLVTITASDSSGNPLGQAASGSNDSVIPDLAEAEGPFAAATVPEPNTWLLSLTACLVSVGLLLLRWIKDYRQTRRRSAEQYHGPP
jgi:CBS domain-containing protein